MPPAGMINRCDPAAGGQVRSSQHAQLARRTRSAPGSVPDVRLIEPVPYDVARGTGFYRQFLDPTDWPMFIRAGYDATCVALRSRPGPALKATAHIRYGCTYNTGVEPTVTTYRAEDLVITPQSAQQTSVDHHTALTRRQPHLRRSAREGPMSAVAPGGQGVVRGRRPLAFREQIEPTVRILVATRLVRQIARAVANEPGSGPGTRSRYWWRTPRRRGGRGHTAPAVGRRRGPHAADPTMQPPPLCSGPGAVCVQMSWLHSRRTVRAGSGPLDPVALSRPPLTTGSQPAVRPGRAARAWPAARR